MWKCPVCNHQQADSLVCSVCGFDGSQDVEQFPTLALLSQPRNAISRLQATHNQILACPACHNNTFLIHLDKAMVECTTCHHQMELALGTTPKDPVPTPATLTGAPVALGTYHTAVLQPDGTVRAVGYNLDGQCNTQNWTEITALAAGHYHTVGLRKDGTVVAVGNNEHGQCMTQDWKDVIAIVASSHCTAGLRKDGTVVMAGSWLAQSKCHYWRDIRTIGVLYNNLMGIDRHGFVYSDQDLYRELYHIDLWQDATAISCGFGHCAVLFADGTVACTKDSSVVKTWHNITAIAAGHDHTVGLRKDGTVVSTISGVFSGHDVSHWKYITAIAAGENYTIGLEQDGTVVATGKNSYIVNGVRKWKDIAAIYAGRFHALGIRKDGTLVAAGTNPMGECHVTGLQTLMPPTT